MNNIYGKVSWSIQDIHSIRENMELPKWEDHEAEAFLEVHDESIAEMMTATGSEWITDLLEN